MDKTQFEKINLKLNKKNHYSIKMIQKPPKKLQNQEDDGI
jgi:hypothetical protein